MRRWVFLVVLLSGTSQAQDFDHSHGAWDALLKRDVVVAADGKSSRVRYESVARDREGLHRYLQTLSAVEERQFQGWNKEQRMAFLINAYNAFMVEKILARYPDIRSVWDFGKLFGNPFKDEFFSLLGKKSSLDGIEHGILRAPGAYDEPRVHFALNCASVGCPMLRAEAYVPDRLETQLEDQAVRFLSDRERNRMRDGRLEVSKIFDWYARDFSSPEKFFSRYAALLADGADQQDLVRNGKAPLSFLDYDWSLNAFPSSSPR